MLRKAIFWMGTINKYTYLQIHQTHFIVFFMAQWIICILSQGCNEHTDNISWRKNKADQLRVHQITSATVVTTVLPMLPLVLNFYHYFASPTIQQFYQWIW